MSVEKRDVFSGNPRTRTKTRASTKVSVEQEASKEVDITSLSRDDRDYLIRSAQDALDKIKLGTIRTGNKSIGDFVRKSDKGRFGIRLLSIIATGAAIGYHGVPMWVILLFSAFVGSGLVFESIAISHAKALTYVAMRDR